MSSYCGQCRNLIFVSTSEDWYTDKFKPESGCESCGHGMETLTKLWRCVERLRP